MEIDLVKNLAEVAPGFIAVAVARLITGSTNMEFTVSKNILDYFMYGGSVWILNLGIGRLCQMLQIEYSRDVKMIVAIMLAVVLAIVWTAYLKGISIKAANWINRKLDRDEIHTDSTIFEREFSDNRDHYVAVFKNNQLIAEGWLKSRTYPEEAFSLIVDKEWAEWFSNNPHEEKAIVYVYHDTYIKEYIPPEQ